MKGSQGVRESCDAAAGRRSLRAGSTRLLRAGAKDAKAANSAPAVSAWWPAAAGKAAATAAPSEAAAAAVGRQ